MKKSKLSILLLFLVMILAISAVSAADTNDTSDSNLQSVDEAPVDKVASADVDNLSSTDSNEVLSTGGGTFTDLQNSINNPGPSKMITLNSNYTRVGDEGVIEVRDTISIIGNGYTIDGSNNGGIFKVYQGGFLFLQNVILINGNSENGGAIYNDGTVVIQNSKFFNNDATLGGAIYNNAFLTITESTFINGSVYNNGNLSLSRNIFDEPIVTTADGAITSTIAVTVLDDDVMMVKDESVTLDAIITDDNGNIIKQIGDLFKFTVDGVEAGAAVYNDQLKKYQALYTLTQPGVYTVNVTYAAGNGLVISSKEKNLINYRGTYTDLQERIATATTTALVLPYDITYNDAVDADSFPGGMVIDKAINIIGNGFTVSGNNACRIFNVTADNVALTYIALTNGKATDGGAVYVDNGGELTVTESTFTNNSATNGAAIYVDGNLIVNDVTLNDDDAVYIGTSGNAEISNSLFRSDKLYAINNYGTLALAGNKVKAISNYGTITSTVKAVVLEGPNTVFAESPNVKLYANVTDDNNNPIYQSGFKFVINNNVNIPANFNEATLLYEADYTLPSFGFYDVNMTGTGAQIINGTIAYIAGTFTELQLLINNTSAGGTLELPHDFTYDATFDGANFPDGVIINKSITIEGNGYTISGNNKNVILYAESGKVVINNVTIANGYSNSGYSAVFTQTDFTIANSTVVNNTDVNNAANGAISAVGLVSDIVFNVFNTVFEKNTVDNGGAAVTVVGVNNKVTYNIYDSFFINNVASIDVPVHDQAVSGGAIFSLFNTVGFINNTQFIGNKAKGQDESVPNGGAIKVQFGGTLTVANSTFEANEASRNGGAISIQSNTGILTSVIIDTCTFTGNSAPKGAAVVSSHNVGSGSVTIINSNFNEDNAVYLDAHTDASISSSVFTSDEFNAITNLGNLELSGNTVKSILNNGTITSQVNAIVLDNKTYETKEANYTLNATLTDDNGNLIKDTRVKFVVNGVTAPNNSTYDETTGLYTYADYPITIDYPKYTVSVSLDSAPNLAVKTGIVKNLRVGTFTDLKAKLDATTADTFVLPYDFTYSAEIDGDLKVIILNKTIDGKGYTISGNNIADIFIVNADVAIKNTVFADVKSFAVYNNAAITLTNNTISKDKALIINNGTISNAVVNVMDGKTLNIKFNQKVTLNATFKDDKGNLIKDDRFAFSITNVASPIAATYKNGLYTAEYTTDKVETKTVDVANIGVAAQVKGTLSIARANVVIIITANDTIERKQKESINVTLKDEFGNLLDGKELDIIITNSAGIVVREFTSTTNDDGEWLEEVAGLGIDNYTITVIFQRTDEFNLKTASMAFKVVQLNITNSFTELQELIQANEGTGNVLVLPHNFKYSDYVDEDFYPEGVLITKDITIDGNGATIDADNVYRILNIADGVSVTIKNVTFINGNATVGAAILTNADSLAIDSCNFINCTSTDGGAIYINGTNVNVTGESLFKDNTADMGGAIFVAVGGNLTVIGAEFDNNTAHAGGAIVVGDGATLTLTGSEFKNNVDNRNTSIGNFGTLALDSNTVDNTIYNNGIITTPVYSTVLGNTTYQIENPSVELTADLVDDNNNKIYDPEFRFVVNGLTVEVKPDYNPTTGIYNITYDITPTVLYYLVNVTSAKEEKLLTKTSILRNVTGTFTDLQRLINKTSAGGTLELPYDFAYIASIDGDRFPEGVVINKAITIDGKGHTISGSNSNRIFRITAATTLNNISLVEGNAAEFGGAIYATANLNVNNSVFDNNTAAVGGAIRVLASTADLTLNINNVNFTNNKVDNAGGAVAIVSADSHDVTYNIYNSLFENNVAIAADGGAIYSYGDTIGLINNTIFRVNKAETGDDADGGAIKIQFGGTLTVANSTFENNVANLGGGAISIQADDDQDSTQLVVEKCTFTNNDAYYGSAIASTRSDLDNVYVTITDSNFDEVNAVFLGARTTGTISNSIFTSADADVYAIYNLGNLKLSGNTVEVIFNNGTITTQAYSMVLDNKTYDITTSSYYINASLVDDNNNKIYDPNFRFVINGQTSDVVPTYDSINGVYSMNLTVGDELVYVVNVASANERNLNTKTSIVREIRGTFTDLQRQINRATGTLNLLYDFIYTPEVDDGNFDEGVLIASPINIDGKGHTIIGNNNKRIFKVTGKNVFLDNITLVNGSGAIYVADGGDLTVEASVFENNTAERGSDVYVADNGKLTVTGTTFNDDNAVYIAELGDASISTSKFTSEEVYAIYNLGSLALSGNTVRLIFNNGTITTTSTATFIGGKEIAAELGDEVTPNATFIDDNGNPIYDSRLVIIVRGNVLETTYNVSTNLYTAKYTIVNAGENIVNTSYTKATIVPGKYLVEKANVTEFTVTVYDIIEGDNATLFVTLIGADGGLTADVQVFINNTEYIISVVDGEAIENIEGLAHGQYPVVAIFKDVNGNYNDEINSTVFNVKQNNTSLEVILNETYEYLSPVTIAFVLTGADDEGITGVIYVSIDGGIAVPVPIVNGLGELTIDNTYSAGSHDIYAEYLGDDTYSATFNDTAKLNIVTAVESIVTITVDNVTYGENSTVTITLTDGEGKAKAGTVYVSIEGLVGQVTVEIDATGVASYSTQFQAGSYTIIATDGNVSDSANFTVAKSSNANVALEANDTVYGDNANITVVAADGETPIAGTATLIIDAVPVDGIYEIPEEGGIITIGNALAPGVHTVIVQFTNSNYEDVTKTISFTVEKATPTLDVNDTEVYYGQDIEIPFKVIGVDGKGINATVLAIRPIVEEYGTVVYDEETGNGTISFSALPAGEYPIVVRLLSEDNNYAGVEKTINLTVKQGELLIHVKVNPDSSNYSDDVNVTINLYGLVPGDKLDAKVIISKDGGEYLVENITIEGIETNITLENLDVGFYNITVVTEEGNYKSVESAPKEFNIQPANIDIFVSSVENVTYGDYLFIGITTIEGPSTLENVIVEISNDTKTVYNMVLNVTDFDELMIPVDFAPGIYSVVVTVPDQGDNYYGDSEVWDLTVNKINVTDDITIEGSKITYGENGTITLELPSGHSNASGTVTVELIGVNGIWTVDLTDGYAVVEIPGLAGNATYSLQSLVYSGDDYYEGFTINDERITIEVNQAESSVVVVAVGATYPDNVTIAYVVKNGTEVTITVLDNDGTDVFNKTISQTGDYNDNFNITGLPAGKYFVVIYNNETENYKSSMDSDTFVIEKASPAFKVEITKDIVAFDEGVEINVTLPVDATGNVAIFVDGKHIASGMPVNGIFNVTLSPDILTAGNHSFMVTFMEDRNYEERVAYGNFKVSKADPVMTMVIGEDNIGVRGSFNATITVANATGSINLIRNGFAYNVELIDSAYFFEEDNLQAGEYILEAYYLGDDNYNKANITRTLTIPKADVSIKFETVTPEIAYGDEAVFKIDIGPDFATGNVTIYVDDEYWGTYDLDEEYANATVTLVYLPVGTHNITVTYSGDDNYNNRTGVIPNAITVNKADVGVEFETLTPEIKYGEDAVISINIDPDFATGDVAIYVGDEYWGTYKLDDEYANATIILSGLTVGKHNITVVYSGDKSYNNRTGVVPNAITVGKADSKTTIIKPIDDVIYGNNVTVFYEIENRTEVMAYVMDLADGHIINITNVFDDHVVIPVLAAGKYQLLIANNMGEVYSSSYDLAGFEVVKATPEISAEALDIFYSQDNIVTVTISPNATGTVSIIVNGKEYTADIEDGAAITLISPVDIIAGENNIRVIYDGDRNYTMNYNSTTFMAYDNVVTNDTFFTYFDEDGVLLDTVPFDDLIFRGSFSGLTSNVIVLDRPISIRGDGSTLNILNGMGLRIVSDDVYVSGLMILNDGTDFSYDNDCAAVYVEGEDVTLKNVRVLYNAPEDGEAYGIYVTESDGFKLIDSVISLQGNETNVDYQYGLIVEDSDDVLISGNKIVAQLPASAVDDTLPSGIYRNCALAVGIQNANNLVFTQNEVKVDVIGETSWTSLNGIMVYGASNLQIADNNITLTDGENMGVGFYQAVDLYNFDGAIENNTIVVNTTTGLPGSGNANAIKLNGPFDAEVYSNDLTVISYGPSCGISTSNKAGRATLYANDNNIYALGSGEPGESDAAVSGIELQVEKAYVYDNVITVESIEEYNETLNVFGISNVQYSDHIEYLDIEDNSVYSDGKYAVLINYARDSFVSGNFLIAYELYGDEAVSTLGEATVYGNYPAELNLIVSVDNITVGEDAEVIISANELFDGDVTVVMGTDEFTVTLTDGFGYLTLSGLAVGDHTVTAYYDGSTYFPADEATTNFTVSKVEIPAEQAFNITDPENSTSQVISVELPEDATGFLLLDINGTQTHVPLVDGKANVTVPLLPEGTYNATITYTGDENYAPISTTKELNVTSNVPDSALNIPTGSKSDIPTTYSISLPSDATGILEVDVDGTKYAAPLNKGSASVTVPALSVGNHNVTVKYSGDTKYSPVVKSTSLSVVSPVYKVTNNKDVSVVYSAKGSYKVLVTRDGKAVGAGESVTFIFNGVKYTVKTDSKGYATLNLNTKVKAKTYIVTAEYKGAKVSNKVKIKHLIIKAKNASVKKSKKVNKIKVKTNKVNGKFLKGKKLTLTIKKVKAKTTSTGAATSNVNTVAKKSKAKKVKAKINKKGVATFKIKKSFIKKLKVGTKYQYTVTYGKDTVTKKLKVKR